MDARQAWRIAAAPLYLHLRACWSAWRLPGVLEEGAAMRHKVWIGARAYTRAELEDALFLATQAEQVKAEARALREELARLHDALNEESLAHEETLARVSELERQLGDIRIWHVNLTAPTHLLWSAEDGGYIATYTDYPTLSGFGKTPGDAICELLIATRAALDVQETALGEAWAALETTGRINEALGRSPATRAGMQLDEALAVVLREAITALEFYGNQVYSHRMGLPPEVQWVAEDALDKIRPVFAALGEPSDAHHD
jgi:hypothetical protein